MLFYQNRNVQINYFTQTISGRLFDQAFKSVLFVFFKFLMIKELFKLIKCLNLNDNNALNDLRSEPFRFIPSLS